MQASPSCVGKIPLSAPFAEVVLVGRPGRAVVVGVVGGARPGGRSSITGARPPGRSGSARRRRRRRSGRAARRVRRGRGPTTPVTRPSSERLTPWTRMPVRSDAPAVVAASARMASSDVATWCHDEVDAGVSLDPAVVRSPSAWKTTFADGWCARGQHLVEQSPAVQLDDAAAGDGSGSTGCRLEGPPGRRRRRRVLLGRAAWRWRPRRSGRRRRSRRGRVAGRRSWSVLFRVGGGRTTAR